MLSTQYADVYTDLAGLKQLKTEAKSKTPEAIKEVAKQFESVFISMVLKSMRNVKLADGILDNKQSDFYRDMYDQQLSVHLSGEGGLGLADIIEKQLNPDQSTGIVSGQKIGDYSRQVLIRNITNKLEEVTNKPKLITEKPIESVPIQAKHEQIQSADDFVNQLQTYAEQAAHQLGLDPHVLLAQSALETGWGQSVIKTKDGISSHNLFNIKADKSWQGKQTKINTLEFKDGIAKKEVAGFRAYSSFKESFEDYVQFIKTNPRYATALKMTDNPERYLQELQQAGYATDPNYAQKVIKIYHSNQIQNQQTKLLAQAPINSQPTLHK